MNWFEVNILTRKREAALQQHNEEKKIQDNMEAEIVKIYAQLKLPLLDIGQIEFY